jgi:hypothetical protein
MLGEQIVKTSLSNILPTPNDEAYLSGLLDAHCNQTWPPL